MTITLETKHLRAAAGEAASVAVSANGAAPIFSNVLIVEEDGGRVRFCATDLDMAIDRDAQAVQGALARSPLRTTVSAKLLQAIADKLPQDAQVAIEMDGTSGVKITSGRSRYRLSTLPAEDFPSFPRGDWDAEFELPAAALASIIDRLSSAISTEETRYYLNGIYFHAFDSEDGPVLRAAATDGSRLARTQVLLPDGAESFPQTGVIVHRKALKVIRTLIDKHAAGKDDEPAKLAIAVSATRIEVDFGSDAPIGTRLSAKLIDGTFPDYSRVIPTGNEKRLKIDKAGLRDAIERVTTIATEKVRLVKLGLTADVATLSIRSPDSGEATEDLPAEYTGAPMDVGFNARFLLEVLARIDGDVVTAEFADPAAPTLWRGEGDADTLFVVMPVRV